MRLNKSVHPIVKYPERIIQFGEGVFLRSFVDWMIDKLNKEANFESSVVIVQPRGKGKVKVKTINEQDGLYTVYLNGIKEGKAVSEHTVIESVSRGINPYENYDEYLSIARGEELRFVVSNTTEAGIFFDENDTLTEVPNSYPGKLTALLYERYKFFNGDKKKGLILLPCELIEKNGQKLREIILQYAKLWNLEDGFKNWIMEDNIFCDTLVDRIVPGCPKDKMEQITKELGYEDSLVVEAEQFHLWVIQAPEKVKEELPLDKCGLNVAFTKDLTPYRERKVRILNGAHTSMVPVSLIYGFETVRETVEDDVMGKFVMETVFDEIIPTLNLPEEELKEFANDVLDRFKNPFMKHYLMSIALNSNSKYETRVLPSLLEYNKRFNKLPKKLVFSLAALICLYKGEINGNKIQLSDNEDVLTMYDKLWKQYDGTDSNIKIIVKEVLANKSIWKMNLNDVEGLSEKVSYYLIQIQKLGMKEALKEVM
ncbi:tagaturonate reductase [Clostridium sp. JS66]|uniref:tagaturonate reductase n=1 Tax=Clostridium sp. JS66 TaxID=3064705 RepID=UPI00298D69EB|nr:tagaturonate reductase [Clostridium sp. JS66]WPC40407.1 tagaturonate reductase [Clostridium sp. JS66]